MTATSEPKPASKTKPTGVVAIVWEPDRDSQGPPAPQGYSSIRGFDVAFVDEQASEATAPTKDFKGELRKTPRYGAVGLPLVGLNWVDGERWNYALSMVQKHNPGSYTRIQQLIADGAIQIFYPIESGRPEGRLEDYSLEDQKRLVRSVYNTDALMTKRRTSQDAELTRVIDDHLATLDKQYGGNFNELRGQLI